jgi:hypothetical protein
VNPAIKKALWPVLALVFGALATYFSTGCTPSQIQQAESAVDREVAKAACVKAVAEKLDDLLADPLKLQPADVLRFRSALKACLKPAPAPVGADAGA